MRRRRLLGSACFLSLLTLCEASLAQYSPPVQVGSIAGGISNAIALAVDDTAGELYLANGASNEVRVYNFNGSFLRSFNIGLPTAIIRQIEVATTPDGPVVGVLDSTDGIGIFSPTGTFRNITVPISGISGIATGRGSSTFAGKFLSARATSNSGVLFSAQNASFLGFQPGLSFTTSTLDVGPGDQIYALSASDSRITVYNAAGASLRTIGSAGNGADQMLFPADIAASSQGRVYVADTANNRVQIYDGNTAAHMGTLGGTTNDPISAGRAVAVSRTGRVFVSAGLAAGMVHQYFDPSEWSIPAVNSFNSSVFLSGRTLTLNTGFDLRVSNGMLDLHQGTLKLAGGSVRADTFVFAGSNMVVEKSDNASTIEGTLALLLVTPIDVKDHAQLNVTAQLTGAGIFTKTGGGTMSLLNGLVDYGGQVIVNAGTLRIEGGDTASSESLFPLTSNGSATLELSGSFARAVTANDASKVVAVGNVTLRGNNAGADTAFSGSSVLDLNGRTVSLISGGILAVGTNLGSRTDLRGGTLQLSNETAGTGGIVATLSAGENIDSNNLSSSISVAGTLSQNGNVIGPTNASRVLTIDGNMRGTGEFVGRVRWNSGSYNPDRRGSVDLTSSRFHTLHVASTASLAVDLGGTSQAVNYDYLFVRDALTLEGSLIIDADDGFAPLPGQEFRVLRWGTRTGTFQAIVNSTPFAGLSFIPTYEANSLLLRASATPGDANLDAKVNFDDLLILAQGYGLSGRNWLGANFNGDDLVAFDDLLLMAQNYGFGTLTGLSEMGIGNPQFQRDLALAFSLVPEPGALTFVAAVAMTAARRARR